jgi:hypothetical protein
VTPYLIERSCCVLYLADILKTKDAVVKVMALYEEVISKADVGSLLIADNNGMSVVADELAFS